MVPVPVSTLFPADKGTGLVLALILAGLALLLAADRGRDSGGPSASRPRAAGTTALLGALFVAGAPGIAGEDGVPLVLLAVVAVTAIAAVLRPWPDALPALGVVAATVLLVAIAPADTSRFLSGDPPHAGERGFLVVGVLLIGVACLGTALRARRRGDALVLAGALTVLLAGAVAHGMAVVGVLR